MTQTTITLVECPRDAMQGWKHFIPTGQKIEYLNSLLQVGFHTLDCGSFVSPKAIPQMADTALVLPQLSRATHTKLLVIVANLRGAEEAVMHNNVSYLGFPFSISSTFQQRNTNSTMEESLQRVQQIQQLCMAHGKRLVIYLSMGFGNPYGDEYNEAVLLHWAGIMADMGITIISLADTIGVATPAQVSMALDTLIPKYKHIQFGVHLHAGPGNWQPKLQAALQAGCNRIDGALMGIGGCPMAGDALVGNMNMEQIIEQLQQQQQAPPLNMPALQQSLAMATQLFAQA